MSCHVGGLSLKVLGSGLGIWGQGFGGFVFEAYRFSFQVHNDGGFSQIPWSLPDGP